MNNCYRNYFYDIDHIHSSQTHKSEYELDTELDFFEENSSKIEKYKSAKNINGLGEDFLGRVFKDDKEDPTLLRRYELFKQSYEKATQTSWTFDKFKERSKYWDFFGDHNGFVSIRLQRSGLYKFTSVAGDLNSISKGLEDIHKKDIPVWGAVSPKISNIMAKKFGYSIPNTFLLKMLYKVFKKSVGDIDTELNSDGTITIHYGDVGTVTKVIILNKGAFSIVKTMIKNKFVKK